VEETGNRPLVVLVTVPADAADTLATALVESRLAACVNALPRVRSTYRWEGHVERADEVLLLVKSMVGAFDALSERVAALHPYDNPEVVALPVSGGRAAYLDWVRESVRA
jgi:periplasmic divalent cation tolerance protein